MIADSVNDKQRGLAFGLHRASDTLGAFLGLGIAALIVWQTQALASLLTLDTFKLIVLASIVPAVLGVLALAPGAVDVGGKSSRVERDRLTLKT